MSGNHYLDEFQSGTRQLEVMQREKLRSLLTSEAVSAYGQAHLFDGLIVAPDMAQTYRRQVPLSNYDCLRPWVDRMVDGEANVLTTQRPLAWFKTSGSTAAPKRIPVTSSLLREKVAAFAIFWAQVHADYPAIRNGALVSNFTDAGASERLPTGLELLSESSFWNRRGQGMSTGTRWPLPPELNRVADTEARLYAVARLLLQAELACIMCLNPSTLLQFCRTIERHADDLARGLEEGDWGIRDAHWLQALDVAGKRELHSYLKASPDAAVRLGQSSRAPRLDTLWPALELIICWQSNLVQPYFRQLAPYLGELPVRDYITQSSECMMAIPLTDGSSGGTLAYTTHFFEFIAEADTDEPDPPTFFAWQLQQNACYEVVVTTGGGLYRYRMGDCVRVTGFNGDVPIIEFLYRLGRTSSITGEKLTEQQVMAAAASASRATDAQPDEFMCFPCTAALPHYAVMIDQPEATDAEIIGWMHAFEKALHMANNEYADKRESGRLGDMQALRVDAGALATDRLQRKPAGVSLDQLKVEVLSRRLDAHSSVPSARWL